MMSQEKENRSNAKYKGHSYSEHACNMLNDAKRQYDEGCYPEAISSCQEAIEFSVKAIFLYSGVRYPKKHDFFKENFKKSWKESANVQKNWAY
jgi:HEPN domain-containing protein